MLSFYSSEVRQEGAPTWWPDGLRTGHAVELLVYGDTMVGRLRKITGDTLSVTVPLKQQVPALASSTAHGIAVISMEGGAARVPVSCWASGDAIRLQVIGPISFIQRREHTRATIRLPVSLGWLREGERSWDHARSFTVDISVGGIQVESATTVWPNLGTPVQLLVAFPDGPWHAPAEAIGKTSDYGLRLRFADLPDLAADRMKSLIGGH